MTAFMRRESYTKGAEHQKVGENWLAPRVLWQTEPMASPVSIAVELRRVSPWARLGLLGALVLLPLVGSADPETEARYPFDPACPWGRISNGKGMLQRCISEAEAQKVAADAKALETKAQTAKPVTSAAPTPAEVAVEPATEPVVDATASAGPVVVKLGPLVAEQGELGLGKLGKPLDRYQACIQDNGGLSAAKGNVVVQFLVRAEFGRAEGVEVKKAIGVSKKAARCLADVVDRRQVGAPTVPLTGATLSFEITPSK